MKHNVSLINPSNTDENDNFLYNDLSGRPYCDLRKMLGRQLFLIRQNYNRTLARVSRETGLPTELIDLIECGIEKFRWPEINLLLDYYKKRVKLSLVNVLNEEQQRLADEKRETAHKLEKAEAIIAKAKERDKIEKEIRRTAAESGC